MYLIVVYSILDKNNKRELKYIFEILAVLCYTHSKSLENEEAVDDAGLY